jgi:uncharacterized membrane protein
MYKQQDLELLGLEGEFRSRVLAYYGIGNVEVAKNNLYQAGDKVLVLASLDENGDYHYYVTDFMRSNVLFYLFGLFFLALLLVGGFKGLRALISLAFSFFVIMGYVVPQILDGADPLIVTLIGSMIILLSVIYLTEGFTKEAHIALLSIFLSLLITVFFSWLFVNLAKLSGFASEEAGLLLSLTVNPLNLKGLLLAGMIIGALGVLDDVVISQITSVKQLALANVDLGRKDLFKKAYAIGISHISSMTNTLFLAYAGASLSLLMVFAAGESGYGSWSQAASSEAIATEIVRTLVGSIGLILAVPIATAIAAYYYKK